MLQVCLNRQASLWLATAAIFNSIASTPSAAQTVASSAALEIPCILAGRINDDQRWAPLSSGLVLLDAQGKQVREPTKQALATVTAVKLAAPALLALCNGNQALPSGDAGAGTKTPASAVKAGSEALKVQAVYYPPGRAGGQWVELQLELPVERITVAVQ